jgi:uncharacterized protein YjbJ (UPF0337 family)
MDKDRAEGKLDDVKGRVKRQVGEWTGDSDLQAEGTADQAKGKIQNAFGKAKDAVRDVADDARKNDVDDVDRKELDEDVA